MRDLGDLPKMSIDQKWNIVYSDEHVRWREEKQREEQARKQSESGAPAAIIDGTPEWYIKKFLDKTITAKQAGSLQVSLRGKEVTYAPASTLYCYSPDAIPDGFNTSWSCKGRLCWRRLSTTLVES